MSLRPSDVSSPPVGDAGKQERIRALEASQSYRQAHLDPQFLGREELRPLRMELELLKPELILQDFGVHSTIVVSDDAQQPLRWQETACPAPGPKPAGPGDQFTPGPPAGKHGSGCS